MGPLRFASLRSLSTSPVNGGGKLRHALKFCLTCSLYVPMLADPQSERRIMPGIANSGTKDGTDRPGDTVPGPMATPPGGEEGGGGI